MISILGAVLAAVYAVVAILVVIGERQPGGGGNWISLRGIGAYVITLPISAPCELLGAKLDYKKNLHMAAAIGGCALLAYLAGAAIEWLGRAVASG